MEKITVKLVRSFGIGFVVYSPKFNGLCLEINFGCFSVCFWNRGEGFFGFENYWE
jgi:hypothetical protein